MSVTMAATRNTGIFWRVSTSGSVLALAFLLLAGSAATQTAGTEGESAGGTLLAENMSATQGGGPLGGGRSLQGEVPTEGGGLVQIASAPTIVSSLQGASAAGTPAAVQSGVASIASAGPLPGELPQGEGGGPLFLFASPPSADSEMLGPDAARDRRGGVTGQLRDYFGVLSGGRTTFIVVRPGGQPGPALAIGTSEFITPNRSQVPNFFGSGAPSAPNTTNSAAPSPPAVNNITPNHKMSGS